MNYVLGAVAIMNWWGDNLVDTFTTPACCLPYAKRTRIKFVVQQKIEIQDSFFWNFPSSCHPYCCPPYLNNLSPLRNLGYYYDSIYPPAIQVFFLNEPCLYKRYTAGLCYCDDAQSSCHSNELCQLGYQAYCCDTLGCSHCQKNMGCSMLPRFSPLDLPAFVSIIDHYIRYVFAGCRLTAAQIIGDTSNACFDSLQALRVCHQNSLAEVLFHELVHALWCRTGHWNGCKNLMTTSNTSGKKMRAIALTSQQLADIRTALSLTNARRFVEDCPYGPLDTLRIGHPFTWEHDARLYRDVVIDSGTTVRLRNFWRLSTGAGVFIKPGCTLILDGGNIVNGCGECGIRLDIQGTLSIIDGVLTLDSGSVFHVGSTGIVEITHQGGLCFQEGVQFLVDPGGKIIIHGIDYTDALLAMLSQPEWFHLVISGSLSDTLLYAYRTIETQGAVTLGPKVTLTAGESIRLEPGFRGLPPFIARIDTNLSGCDRSPCLSSNLSSARSYISKKFAPTNEMPEKNVSISFNQKGFPSVTLRYEGGMKDRALIETAPSNLPLLVRVYTIDGRLLLEKLMENPKLTLYLYDYPQGAYFIGVWSLHHQILVKRMVIMK